MNLNERESIPSLAAVCLHGRWHNVGFYAKVVAALQATLRGRLDRVKLQYALLAESRYTGEVVVPSGNRKYQFSRRARHITRPVLRSTEARYSHFGTAVAAISRLPSSWPRSRLPDWLSARRLCP